MRKETGLLRCRATIPRSPRRSCANTASSACLREFSSVTRIALLRSCPARRTSSAPTSGTLPSSVRSGSMSCAELTRRVSTVAGSAAGNGHLPSLASTIRRFIAESCLILRSTTVRPATCRPAPVDSPKVARTRTVPAKVCGFSSDIMWRIPAVCGSELPIST